MPFVSNTTLSSTRKANTVLSSAFFPRIKKSIFPKISRPYTTTSLAEPHAVIGAAPPMRRYTGYMASSGLPSWTINVPSLLYKNLIDIARRDMEGDQTRTLYKMADQFGVILSKVPDQILLSRIMRGHQTTSTTVIEAGVTYNLTLDGQPLFSASHTTGPTLQSNIIQTALPATVAGVVAQDPGITGTQVALAHAELLHQIQTVQDNQGQPMYPNFDPSTDLVYLVPPILQNAYKLALQMASVMGGSPGGAQGTTTNAITGQCKDVLSSGLLNGFPDPDGISGNVTPSAATDVYAFIVGDYVAPFYQQLFRPPNGGDLFPKGYSIEAEVSRILNEANTAGIKVSVSEAVLFAGSIVEHNFDAVGDRATRDVVEKEMHFVSGRSRTNFSYGFWPTAWKLTPTGYSS
jgi:hypothetical protein